VRRAIKDKRIPAIPDGRIDAGLVRQQWIGAERTKCRVRRAGCVTSASVRNKGDGTRGGRPAQRVLLEDGGQVDLDGPLRITNESARQVG
jgi:hypothetical protein